MGKLLTSLVGFFIVVSAYSQVLVYQGSMRGTMIGAGETAFLPFNFYLMRDMSNDDIYLYLIWQDDGEKQVEATYLPNQAAITFFDLEPQTSDVVVLDGGNRKIESLRLRIGGMGMRLQGTTQGPQLAQPLKIGTGDQSTWSIAPAHNGTMYLEMTFSEEHVLAILSFSTRLHAPLTMSLNQQGLSGEAAADEIIALLVAAGYTLDN